MAIRKFSNVLLVTAVALVALAFCPASFAQGPTLDAPVPAAAAIEPTTNFVTLHPAAEGSHKFWDRENTSLFLAATAMNGADFAVTHANLQSGGQELNPIVRVFGRSTAGLAVNFVGETAGVITLSYFFHKTGHHKLERAVSYVNIGSSAGAVAYGLAHR